MSHVHRWVLVCSLVGVVAAAQGKDALTMNVSAALQGMTSSNGTIPVAVEFVNNGPDARGVLHVSSASFDMDYPIELPRGSQKRLLTYPNLDYNSVHYSLRTNQGVLFTDFLPTTSSNQQQVVLLISQSPGLLGFLRSNGNGNGEPPGAPPNANSYGIADAYSTIADVPNRPVGFANCAAVVLGEGAERLSDDQAEALKVYVLAGGTLVFLGGASSLILEGNRWASLLPAHDFHVENLANSEKLASLGNADVPAFSVMDAKPNSDATVTREGRVLLAAESRFGLGRVVYCAFNPLEGPLAKWVGRKDALERLLRLTDFLRGQAYLAQFGTPNQVNSPRTGMRMTPILSAPASGFSGPVHNDPFSTTLPSTSFVFTILIAYFIVVIPLNFLLLKKFKKGEWAWVSAPVISLGFAGVFFSSAGQLYSAKMSSATQGVLIGQEGFYEGLFVGGTQLFIPQVGTYDLKLRAVDSLGVEPINSAFTGMAAAPAGMNAQDVGEIRIAQLEASNLTFRELTYRQRYVPMIDWFHIKVQPAADGEWRCEVTNTSHFALLHAKVVFQNTFYSVSELLQPGQTKSISLKGWVAGTKVDDSKSDLLQFLGKTHRAALTGELRDFRPGPQIGTEITARTNIQLVLFSKEESGS